MDIGLNSKYQASKSVNTAFYQRMTGNCVAFINKVVDIYRDELPDIETCLVVSLFFTIPSFAKSSSFIEANIDL